MRDQLSSSVTRVFLRLNDTLGQGEEIKVNRDGRIQELSGGIYAAIKSLRASKIASFSCRCVPQSLDFSPDVVVEIVLAPQSHVFVASADESLHSRRPVRSEIDQLSQ